MNLKLLSRCLPLVCMMLLFLVGCTHSSRPQTQSDIRVVYPSAGALRWYVPAGGTIRVTVENHSNEDLQWVLLAHPLKGAFDAEEQPFILEDFEAPANDSIQTEILAPAAPAEYDVLLLNADGQLQASGLLVTVIP